MPPDTPKRRIILHPVLFAVLPILFLYSHNIGQLSPGDLLLPAALAVLASLLLWWVTGRLLHDRAQASLIVSLFWLWFFSHGHLLALVQKVPVLVLVMPERYTFTTIYCVLLFAAVVVLIRRGAAWRSASPALNFVAVVLIAWQAVTIGRYELQRLRANRSVPEAAAIPSAETAGTLPNIYFIILDGYARADVLRYLYHYDNREFLDYLADKGFIVPPRSRANYSQTLLSLASCWNLEYLDDLVAELGPESGNRTPLQTMIAFSRVRDFLRRRGYRIVTFSTGYDGTELRTADLTLGQVDGLSLFQSALLNTTPLPSAFVSRRLFGMDEADIHRRRVRFTVAHLPDTAALRPPVFVFAHIVSPHPPFVFDRNGRPIPLTGPYDLGDGPQVAPSRDEYVRKYRDQVLFVNRQTRAALDRLLAASERPPIILLQGDHGPGSMWDLAETDRTAQWERLCNFSAYYLPGPDPASLPDDMSLVNVFRVVFDRYFGAHLPLLPNESYFSPWMSPYRFTRVTDVVNRTAPPAAADQGP